MSVAAGSDIRRPLLAIAALSAAILPGAAMAQDACTAINGGAMNFSVGYNTPSAAADPGARANVVARNYQGLRSSGFTSNSGNFPVSSGMYGASTYTFNAGDTIRFTITASGLSGGFTAAAGASTENTGTFSTTPQAVGGTTPFEVNVTAATNAVALQIRRDNPNNTGSFSVTATCTAAQVAPSVTSQPSDRAVGAGATATFTAAASGTPTPAVQWEVSNSSGGFDPIAGATSPTYSFTAAAADDRKRYRAVFTNSAGNATSSAATLTVVAATSVAPPSGPEAGNTEVTVTGTGFDPQSTVAFGGAAATSVVVNSRTQLRAVSPAGAGQVNIRVTTAGATSPAAAANQFTYVPPAPAVASIAPTGGSSGGGTQVTITGSDFRSGNTYTATFGAATVAATYVNATTLTATTPAGTGTVAVTVTNTTTSQAATGSANYAYAAPTVTGLSATAGPANQARANVTITGTNFTPGATVSVGGSAATSVVYGSATQLTATLPALSAGAYSVRVTTGAVQSAANPPADQYTYVAAPTVTGVNPNSGSTGGGTSVTINGTNLNGATAVTFGGNAGTITGIASDGTSLTATTPSGTAGARDVAVTTPGGSGTLGGGFTYVTLQPPAVTTNPGSQTVAVGATATFTAAAAGSPTPTVQWEVSVGGNAYTPISGATATSYTTPTTTAGDNGNRYRAVFTNSTGTATTNAATLTVVQAPTANPQSVTATYQTGRTITLTANDPNQPARTLSYAVATNPTHGTLSNLNAATGAVTYTPATGYAGADSFTFTASNGTATSAPATVSITVQGPLATVSTVAPDQGPVGGNTPIVVTGTGFTGATALRVGGATATNFVVESDSRITATTPPGTAGTASVAVVNATGTSTANGVFTYVAQPAAPVVTAPANGVTTNLRTPTYSGTAPAGTTVTVIVDNAAVGQTTANAGGGFSLPQPSALTDGSHSVRANASNAGGTSVNSATNSFTVDATAPAAPSITMPLNGATTTSRRPVISGSAEANSRVTITIDTDLAQSVTADANGLFSYTPAADIGIGQHSVYATATDAANNLSPRSATTSFTVVGAPTVTGITPTSGPNAGGTNVTIQGTNFAAGATVAFAGTQATNVTVVDANTITARTPQIVGSGAVDVAVTTGAGTGTRTAAFTYLAPPAAPVLTTPANNATTTSRTPTYSGTAAAGATVAIFVNGAQVGTATATGGSFSLAQPTALGDATYSVYATATNGGGTSADSATTRFVVDATAPATPSIATPTGGQVFGTPTPTYSGTAEAGATVRIQVDGGVYTTTATGGSWTLQQPTPLGAGAHSISARAEDAAGNVSANSGAVAFRVVGAPTIGSVGPARGTAAGGTTITITGSNLSGATRVQVGGTDATILTNPNDATITARTPPGTAGAASVAVTNPAGTATATNSFTYVAAPVAQAQDVAAGFNAATDLVLGASNSPTRYDIVPGDIPRNGSLTGTAPNLRYVPNSGYNGTDRFSFTATNDGGTSAPAIVSITVVPPTITINGATPAGERGVAYPSTTLTATGGTAPYSLGLAPGSGPLPSGLSFRQTDRNSAVIDGTPTQSGTFQITVRAIDSSRPGVTATRTFDIVIAGPTLSIAPGSLPAGTAGVAYSQTFSASGGTSPYTYTLAEGTLPAGMTLAQDGTLSGTPAQAGSFAFRVAATDSSPASGGGPFTTATTVGRYTLTIARPTIIVAPPTVPNPRAGTPYSQAISASGGTGPYTFTVSSGALPAGLTLGTTGVLSGTATTAGDFSFEITATDANRFTGARIYTVTVAAATVTLAPTTLPAATVGAEYTSSVTANGGTAPYSYAISAGTLPAGIALSADGTLSGTPTAGGSFTFTVRATDSSTGSGPFAGERQYQVTVAAPTIAIAPASLPGGSAGIAYSAQLTASGGTPTYAFTLAAGTLPRGITLSSAGLLSGTPTQSGSFTFSVRATDASTGSGPYAGTRSYTVAISAPALVLAPTTIPDGAVGTAYSQTLSASGGTAPYSYAVVAGDLPQGVTLSADGTLSGTPSAGGSFRFTVAATDASPAAAGGPYQVQRGYTLTVAAPTIALAPATLPAGQVRVAYSQTLSASGGTAPYSYAVTAGALPQGMTLATNGTVSGTPSQAGSFTFSVTATDSSVGGGPYAATRSYTLGVTAPTIVLAPETLPDATTRVAYSQAITATGGAGTYSYAVTAGALPAGFALSTGGTLSGAATTAGSFAFTVTATDANGNPGSRSYTLAVASPAITLAPATLPAATTRAAYSQAITAAGGTGPYSYAVTAGALPQGITLATGGTLSGATTTAGSFAFTVTATDANGNSGSRGYTLAVASPTITLAPATLPAATTRVAYRQTLTASGGVAPYGYAVTTGALPQGIVLATDGTLSGATATAGSFDVTITATDANGNLAARAYTLTVTAPAVTIAPATLPAATTRVAYSQTITASGGTAPYSYAVTAGALPQGLTLATGGTLSGTPTAAGSFGFTVTATDANGNGAGQAYTLAVTAPAIALAPQTLPDTAVAAGYAQRLTATGGSGTFGFAVTAGALPAGVTLATDGALSGTPTAGGRFAFTATATDADGNTGSRPYTLTVAAPTIALAPTTLPGATNRVAYRQSVTASGGVAPYTYAVTAGALPAGLTLAADGTLAGSPTTSGSFAFTVTATDSATGSGPYAGTQSYTLVVAAPTITLAPTTLPGGIFNVAYAAELSATGGTAPYAYAVTAGALPGGITLSPAGRLAGMPTEAGQYGFTVSASDANGNAGSRAYTVAIEQAAQTISFANPGARSLSDSPVTLAATASSGLPVAFTTTTSGICTVQGASVTLLATGTCTIEARQDGNGDVAAAPPVAQSFAVTAARLTATAAQASVAGQVGVALAPVTPVSIAGGTAPYAYALSGGPLPAGLAFAEATGTLSGTPTGGQAATAYTVTVRDAGGQSASAGFTLTIAAPTLAIAPTTLPDGAFQAAYSQQLTAAGGTQPYRFAVTAGALPAGLTLSTGGLVSGTPTAFGRFAVTITATDSSTGTGPYSASQAYTLAIAAPAAPTAGDAAVTVAYGSADTVITPTLGGEVTALAIVGQPTHGTARVDGRTLVYAPVAGHAGPDRFTYAASNAGGTSAPGTVSVTVSAPAVAITPTSLPDARQDVAYSQQLTAAGGTAPYAFVVASGSLPTGLTLAPTGLLSGTPTGSGSASFTVRATDSSTGTGPFAATQGYTLAVAVAAAPTVRPVPTVNAPGSSTAASTPTQIVLSDFVTGNVTGIEVVTQPQNGTVSLATAGTRTTATYTPRPGFAGTDSFGFVAVGPGGRSPVTSIALSVTGTAPVIAPLTATATQGVPVTVDLTAAATGGPFTAATVTGVSPAGSVTAQVVEGGTASARTYGLRLLPSLSFSGTAVVTYTLANQFGASAPATVTLTVAARPDPSSDANVNGLSAAQADATRRFARSQTDNFFRRNEQLHHGGTGTGGRDMGVGFQVADLAGLGGSGIGLAPDVNDMAMLKSEHAQAVLGAELASGAVVAGQGGMNGIAGLRGRQVLQQGTGASVTGPGLALDQATGEGRGGDVPAGITGERRVGSIGIWSGGAVTVGAWDKDADRAKLTLTTSGLSAGADIKLADTLIVGAGGGYGADLTRVGGGKARIRGRSWSVAGYGSWAPTDGLFVDGIFGGGSLDFDTRREVAQTGAIATGSRDGTMLFGSLAAGLDRQGSLDLSAYGRVDWLSARLDRYSEAGGGIYGLTFGRRDLESVASVLGLRVGYPQPGWTPRIRGEWRHEFADTDAQLIDYADVANLRYATRGDFWIRDAFTIDVGVEFGLGRGWGVTTEIGASGGSGATAGTARIGVRKQF